MGDSQRRLPANDSASIDSRVYGIGWVGLLASAAGMTVGMILMFSEGGSVLVGAAVMAVSVSLGVLVYLVSKVLDRQ